MEPVLFDEGRVCRALEEAMSRQYGYKVTCRMVEGGAPAQTEDERQ